MPPKRRTDDGDTPNDPTSVPIGRPELPPPPPPAQAAPPKRQRVSRACDQCRAARERCDGKQPECYPCISQSRPCTYEVSPKKRGVQTGYIRTLELALGWIFERAPDTEQALCAFLAHEGGQGHPLLAGKDPGGAERLQRRWRKSRVHKGIDRILSGEAGPSPARDGKSPSADTSDAEENAGRAASHPYVAVPCPDAPVQEPSDGQPEGVAPRPASHLHQASSSPGLRRGQPPSPAAGNEPPQPVILRLPPNHWRLLDVYFSYTHSWLPILDKRDLFQASYLYPAHGLVVDPADASSAVHAELWAALALASLQDAASSSSSPSHRTVGAAPAPREIYDTARRLLPTEDGPFQAHHARAFLLLGLVNLGQDKLTGAGLLTGTAIRILLDPDTARRGGAGDLGGQNTKLALMSCFIVDTVLSVRCNRPPHLRAEDLADVPLASEGTVDQWEPWTPCDGFGTYPAGSRSSRSPAFCLSTFNQLYAIMRVVARHGSPMRPAPSSIGEPGAFLTQLHQAIDPNLPFASFVTSPSCGTSSVPTPYVARIVYLWAGTLTDRAPDGILSMLHDTLDQYEQLFGKCGIPPLISACIASLANDERLSSCGEQSKERRRVLASAYSTRRLAEEPPSRLPGAEPDFPVQVAREPPETTASTEPPAPDDPGVSYPGPFMPSVPPKGPTSRLPPHNPGGRGHNPIPIPGVAELYQGPLANQSGAYLQGGSIPPMPFGAAVGSLPGMAPAAAPTGHNHHHHAAPHPLNPPGAFGTTPDYDALLDDLASIECTDAVDVDPQFMTNLGFAPGYDIAELLARNFGAV